VLGIAWYTRLCTKVASTAPTVPNPLTSAHTFVLTLGDWQQAYAAGASPFDLLAHYGAAADAPAADQAGSVWIMRAGAAQLQPQLQALAAREAALGGRAQALAALPLFGVPFAVKDNIDVQGWPTTAACPAFEYTAAQDAHAVALLKAAGAICVGKTNLDQFATGLVGVRSPYGQPASAFDGNRVSGGSSSGSAVAVARGWVPFALGTDTAGSGRVPAGFNSIVGLKPTPGRISTRGVVPACRTLDCVSIFALTVEDAACVLAVMEGDDPQDAYSAFAPRQPAWRSSGLRLGVPAVPQLDAAYAQTWDAALQQAQALGHTLVPMDFAALHQTAELLYSGPWVAERHAAVQPMLEAQPEALDPTVRSIIEGAVRFSATDTFRAQYALRAAQKAALALWQTVDVLMVPTAPGHPTFEQLQAEPVAANARLGVYTNFVNLLGWCALALPAGFTEAGLPFGVTLIAAGGCDAALARVGAAWQRRLALPLGATGECFAEAPALRLPAREPMLALAVVGAHLSGLPLNSQLLERGATLLEATFTAPCYRLYALPGTVPPKPGLVRTSQGGAAVAVEVWEIPLRHVGSFLALIPAPLGLGSLSLADGRHVHGFVCEAHAIQGARDITAFGGWRAFVNAEHAVVEPVVPLPSTLEH
jgi:allophanate hydrolase